MHELLEPGMSLRTGLAVGIQGSFGLESVGLVSRGPVPEGVSSLGRFDRPGELAALLYGAMPNLGLYSRPDGPVPNPGELMPMGRIEEAQEAYEEAIEMSVDDIVYVASAFYQAGCDGINIDTVGAAGDPDFKAALLATEKLRDKHPDISIEIGMAGEFVEHLIQHRDREPRALETAEQVIDAPGAAGQRQGSQ